MVTSGDVLIVDYLELEIMLEILLYMLSTHLMLSDWIIFYLFLYIWLNIPLFSSVFLSKLFYSFILLILLLKLSNNIFIFSSKNCICCLIFLMFFCIPCHLSLFCYPDRWRKFSSSVVHYNTVVYWMQRVYCVHFSIWLYPILSYSMFYLLYLMWY